MKQSISLNGDEWILRASDLTHVPTALHETLTTGVDATVPGCVHTDLMSAGLLDDPYLADNELKQFWIGRTSFEYETTFDLQPFVFKRGHVELVFDGLDTIASIELNGHVVGESKTMHAPARFDIKSVVRREGNRLIVRFAAPMPYAESQRAIYPGLPCSGGAQNKINPHNLIRKMSCNMGWDWGPEVTTSGIWRSVRIEAWDGARIEHVRPRVIEANKERAIVEVHVDVAGDTSCEATATIDLDDRTFTLSGQSPLRFTIENPQLWWPVGHGAQPLYGLSVVLNDATGNVLDVAHRLIGIRTAELEIKPDPAPAGDPIPKARGESMTLKINGKPIYLKGANWIPDDCFAHRVTPERYRRRIDQALDANMNMLRVWGGGIFEDDAFYDYCDKRGVLVWQDFLFACACYPEEQPYRTLVEKEVRANVARLAAHPSLVVWNGCNENIMATFDWGPDWRAVREEGKYTWGLGYYLQIIPDILRELDPTRPYWPASPYSGSMERSPNANEWGNTHIWDVWHGTGNYRNYLAHYPRMATEFGYHGPATYATIARSIPPDQRTWDSPLMKLHNKNGNPGQEQTNKRMADDFVPPTENYDDWHFLAQVVQVRALSMGIEWFRALHPWNSGALYWQFNDCYPVSSWSAIDGDGRAKPLLHASRRFFAPRLVTIKPRRVTPQGKPIGLLAVYLQNDTDEPWKGDCTLRHVSLHGETLGTFIQRVQIEPRANFKFDVPESMHAQRDALLVAQCGESRGWWWFSPDREVTYPPPKFSSTLKKTGTRHELTIHAESLLRDLCVFPDRLDANATIDDACVSLLPGESHRFVIESSEALTEPELTRRPVLNCANWFGGR